MSANLNGDTLVIGGTPGEDDVALRVGDDGNGGKLLTVLSNGREVGRFDGDVEVVVNLVQGDDRFTMGWDVPADSALATDTNVTNRTVEVRGLRRRRRDPGRVVRASTTACSCSAATAMT